MSVATTLLGLLQNHPAHGYELKREYDARFAGERPLAYGQVYATLARLLKNGLVEEAGTESGDGPDRKRYAITEDGVADVERWLSQAEQPAEYLQSNLYTKVVLALMTDRSAHQILDAQREAHLVKMRELTQRKRDGDLLDQLLCDHALFHLEADLRWLELTSARLDDIAKEVRA